MQYRLGVCGYLSCLKRGDVVSWSEETTIARSFFLLVPFQHTYCGDIISCSCHLTEGPSAEEMQQPTADRSPDQPAQPRPLGVRTPRLLVPRSRQLTPGSPGCACHPTPVLWLSDSRRLPAAPGPHYREPRRPAHTTSRASPRRGIRSRKCRFLELLPLRCCAGCRSPFTGLVAELAIWPSGPVLSASRTSSRPDV